MQVYEAPAYRCFNCDVLLMCYPDLVPDLIMYQHPDNYYHQKPFCPEQGNQIFIKKEDIIKEL